MKPKTRFNKLTAWLLTVAMLMTFIPSFTIGVSASDTLDHDNHSEWTPITADMTEITTGNYYLPDNVISTVTYEGAEDERDKYIPISGDVNICLNGHTWDLGESYLRVPNGNSCVLSITSCADSNGTITTSNSNNFGVICVRNSTATLHNVTLDDEYFFAGEDNSVTLSGTSNIEKLYSMTNGTVTIVAKDDVRLNEIKSHSTYGTKYDITVQDNAEVVTINLRTGVVDSQLLQAVGGSIGTIEVGASHQNNIVINEKCRLEGLSINCYQGQYLPTIQLTGALKENLAVSFSPYDGDDFYLNMDSGIDFIKGDNGYMLTQDDLAKLSFTRILEGVTVGGQSEFVAQLNTTDNAIELISIPTYTVSVDQAENGTVEADKATAKEGETVTLNIEPDDGYELDTLNVKDADNGDIAVDEDNKFTMPASNVTVTATFKVITEHTFNWSGSVDVVNTPEFDLMPYLPEDIIVESVALVGLPNILSGFSPTYSTNMASVKLTTRVFDEPCSETVNVVVESSNYPDITFNIVVSLTGKYIVTIKADAQNTIYDGNPHEGYANVSGTLSNSKPYEGAYTYSYEKADGTPLDAAPTEVGDYKVTIAVPEDDETYKGSLTLEFSIKDASEPEASYQSEENGEWKNATFSEALANVYEGGTVKLLHDIIVDSTVILSRNVTITSADADNICTITTETDAHGYLLNITADVTLENVIVDGGSESGLTAKRALIAVNGGKLNIGSGAVVRNNNNTTNNGIGGGVCVITGELVLDGGTISGNTGYFGGGVGLAGGIFTAEIGSITRNSAKMGGGVCVWENGANVGAMNVTGNVSISENSAEYYGGGVNCHYNGSVTLSSNPVISNNTSPEETDGGIYLDGNQTDGHASIYVNGLTDGAEINFYTWLKSEGLLIAEPADEYAISDSDLAKMKWNGNGFVLAKNDDGNVVLAVPSATYTVTVNSAENGTVEADNTTAAEGDTVTLTVTPDEGFELDTLTVTGASGDVEVTAGEDNTYTFTMPAEAVTVTATFKAVTTPEPELSYIEIDLGARSDETNVRYAETDGVVTTVEEKDNKYLVEVGEENLLIEFVEKTADGEFVKSQYFYVDMESEAATKLNMDSYMQTYDEKSIRIKDPMGMRFKSHILTFAKFEETAYAIDEYGYIIATKDYLDGAELTLDTGKKAVGIGYNKADGTDIVLEGNDEQQIFTGVLKNIPVAKYKTDLVCKTYTKITVNGEQFVVYGEPVEGNVYDTANECLKVNPDDADMIKIILDYENSIGVPGDDLYPNE